MEYKIGDKVKTHNDHDRFYGFSFEGIVDDIQSSFVIVYGKVSDGLGKSEYKHLRTFHNRNIELLDKWFEGICGTCLKVKLVHDDERDTLGNPGFICKDCENNRKDFEKFMEDMISGDED